MNQPKQYTAPTIEMHIANINAKEGENLDARIQALVKALRGLTQNEVDYTLDLLRVNLDELMAAEPVKRKMSIDDVIHGMLELLEGKTVAEAKKALYVMREVVVYHASEIVPGSDLSNKIMSIGSCYGNAPYQ